MRTTFLSYNKQIPLDVFTPNRTGKFPIVCALHGSGGLHNIEHVQFAQMLANQGFCVVVPHYFEATGTNWADDTTIWREFPVWLGTINDALDEVAKQSSADPDKIGVVGFSLGGYLALALGSEQQRVRAVVEYFGGIPDYYAERLERMPPTLILHGEADNRVPVSEAYKLAELLDQRRLPYEMKLYKNAGHGFRGFDMMDAGQRTLIFLKQHLR